MLRARLIQVTNAKVVCFTKVNGEVYISMLKKEKAEFEKVKNEYLEFVQTLTQKQKQPQDFWSDEETPEGEPDGEEAFTKVTEHFVNKLLSNINLTKTRIMLEGTEGTIKHWIERNWPDVNFKLNCREPDTQPFVTVKAYEWDIDIESDDPKQAAAIATATQKLLSSFKYKVLKASEWKYKQLAFAKQVNVWFNHFREEAMLYTFGEKGQTRLDMVAMQVL